MVDLVEKIFGGGGTQTQTADTSPWKEQQPYLVDAFDQAQHLYNAPGQDYYPYAMTAPLSPSHMAGMQSLQDFSNYINPMYSSMGMQAADFGMNQVMNPNANPYMQSYVNAAIKPLTENLMQNVMPQIGSGAQSAGAYGGARHGLLESRALDDYMKNVTDTTSQMYNNSYNQGLGVFMNTMSQLPMLQNLHLAGGDTAMRLGDFERSYNQQLIGEDVDRYNYYRDLPQQRLGQYLSAITGNYGGSTSTTSPKASALQSTLGGALTGWAAAGGNPWGAVVGGAGGYLGSR